MARKGRNLTKELVRVLATNIPTDKFGKTVKRKCYGDILVPGLLLEVFVNSKNAVLAHWCYRNQSLNKRVPLGSYPEISLDKAREKALAYRLNPDKLMAQTLPEQKARLQKSYAATTLRAVSEMWFEHAKAIHYFKKDIYRTKEKYRFAKSILSVIGSVPIDALTLENVSRAFQPFWEKEATRERTLGTLRNKRIHDATCEYVRKGGKENRRYMVHLMHVYADFALDCGQRTPEKFLNNENLFERFCTGKKLSKRTKDDYRRAGYLLFKFIRID